jgi:WD40 repeat protein
MATVAPYLISVASGS